jgi:hypothetical protein
MKLHSLKSRKAHELNVVWPRLGPEIEYEKVWIQKWFIFFISIYLVVVNKNYQFFYN